MKRLFLYFIPSLCFCFPLVAQQPELILQDKFYLEEIEYEELRTITHFPGSGNLKVLDETRGILLFGMVELALLDLQTGEIGKKMDVHELFRWVSDALYEHWGEEYCVPGREAFMQLKPKHYPIRFDRVLKYPGKNLYASLTHTVVLNQETEEEERDNFIGLVVFNEELEIVDFFPLKGYEELRSRPSMSGGGGFLYQDLLFTRSNWNLRPQNYQFVKYQKNPDGYYQMEDTMTHWRTLPYSEGLYNWFYNILEKDGGFHIPMADRVLMIEDWDDSGVFRKLPLDTQQYILSIEPIDQTGWYAAVVTDRVIMRDREIGYISGHLSLISPGYQRVIPQKYHYLFSAKGIRSLTVFDHHIFLLIYDRKKKKYAVEIFKFDREI